ncbi:hypothetical protein BLA60_17015 [Actinophytocola xinjiangensis]|uniref:Acyl transferase domain-containing protein n=1 Tax=Actinophytocola xinjiangensis TaxID=485602 RepID=A0A7Z1AY61_9PSEU|nr:type I polyketide synthase [Actinophytocola xinjiangensis]OLF10147.1 hypothetical protein BLA60_17015 [Actinophytocola xinjiangensis]
MAVSERSTTGLEIAVIGMAGRFPAAADIEEFWHNLVENVDAVTRFTDDELREVGVADDALADPRYVRAKGVFPDVEFFDADFFNYTPADATLLDPQVRALHQEAFHALEDAGYSADNRSEAIGLFLGATNNLPWETHTLTKHILGSGVMFTGIQLNDKDFAATRIAYALGLRGPAMTVHSACSTSLVAVDLACRNLWTGACQIAMAGGSGLTLPHKNGYRYQENMIHSPDGVCRPFDKDAGGTIEGNGAGVVVLKRLETAVRDGDRIYAVIKGSAINNDGNRKVGYTAPSIEGQAEVIRKAHRVANVKPASVSYVETHGTGTALGDPIEIEALRKAFGPGEAGTTGVGSLKASIGHLDTAAGVASLIKTAKILEQRLIPRTPHFTELNPNISLTGSPFTVVTENQPLPPAEAGGPPLRAGVSAFGIGGTNVHLVMEEPPARRPASGRGREYNTFLVSASSAAAIQRLRAGFVEYLAAHPDTNGADLAWTVQNRQRGLAHRYAVPFRDATQLAERLQDAIDADEPSAQVPARARGEAYFLFSGLGAQHLRMAIGLYESEPAFREAIDECFAISSELGHEHFREVFFGESARAEELLANIEVVQVLLFMIECSMARTLIGWGLTPKGMIGHSTGELAAAHIAGVFSLADGIRLVQARASLMDTTPLGALTSVRAAEQVVLELLGDELGGALAIAAVNGPEDCTVSGTPEAVADLERRCVERDISVTHIEADHAYHSQFMDSVLDRFREVVDQIPLSAPTIPYTSNVTGTWITDEQATDPAYYPRHVRSTVRFKDGVEALIERGASVFVEVGPGRSLSSLVRATSGDTDVVAVNMLRHRMKEVSDGEHLADAIGKLWEAGVALDWKAHHTGREPRKLTLPLYPFEKTPYPVGIELFQQLVNDPTEARVVPEPTRLLPAASTTTPASLLTWTRSVHPALGAREQAKVLVALTEDPKRLRRLLDPIPHWRVIGVGFGDRYDFQAGGVSTVRPGDAADLARLLDDLQDHALVGDTFLIEHADHAWMSATLRALCAALPGLRERCVGDVLVLDTADATRTSPDLLARLVGLNHEHTGFRVRTLWCDAPVTTREGREHWQRVLRQELESTPPEDLHVRYEGERRLVPRLVPLHGGEAPDDVKSRETVVVCQAGDVADVLAGLSGDHAATSRRILPYGTDPVPAGDTVLPAATIVTLADRLAAMPEVDEIVLWDTPRTADRRRLVALLAGVAASQRAHCSVLSRARPDRTGWSGELTDWLADGEVLDAAYGLPRLLAFGELVTDGVSVLDLFPRLRAGDLRTAHHGLDLLASQTAGKDVATAETSDVDQRQAIEQIIERELYTLLGIADINHRADIFDIGLDSVKLVQFTTAMERNGHKVFVNDVYNHPTVSALATFVSRMAGAGAADGHTLESLSVTLGERLGVPCEFREVKPDRDEDVLLVLFVDGLDDALRRRAIAAFTDLRVGTDLLPHYILTRPAGVDLDGGLDFADLRTVLPAHTGDSQAVFDEIDRRQAELRRAIGSQPVNSTYAISGMQKQHFKWETRLQLYLVQFRQLMDVEVLQRALRDVVGRHGLLRSFVYRSLGRLRWKEFEAPRSFALPVMDLSGLDPRRQEELRADLVRREWSTNFEYLDKPMYQAVLVKYNERNYDLLFQFDHSVFDVSSGQLLRGDLLRRYEELLAGTIRAMPVAKSFRHLQAQLAKGPVGITSEELIERFALTDYVRHAKRIEEKTAHRADRKIRDIRFSVDLERLNGGEDESEMSYVVLHLYARVVSRLLGVDMVTLIMLLRARNLEDKDFSEIMGMALGGVPVLVPGGRDTVGEIGSIVAERFRMVNKNNICFLSMVRDLRSIVRNRKILGVMGKTMRPTCLLNFVGNVEDEYDAIWDMTLAQLEGDQNKLDYADFYGVSKMGNGRLDLLILTKWVDDPAEVVSILDEEVEYLARSGGR